MKSLVWYIYLAYVRKRQLMHYEIICVLTQFVFLKDTVSFFYLSMFVQNYTSVNSRILVGINKSKPYLSFIMSSLCFNICFCPFSYLPTRGDSQLSLSILESLIKAHFLINIQFLEFIHPF